MNMEKFRRRVMRMCGLSGIRNFHAAGGYFKLQWDGNEINEYSANRMAADRGLSPQEKKHEETMIQLEMEKELGELFALLEPKEREMVLQFARFLLEREEEDEETPEFYDDTALMSWFDQKARQKMQADEAHVENPEGNGPHTME